MSDTRGYVGSDAYQKKSQLSHWESSFRVRLVLVLPARAVVGPTQIGRWHAAFIDATGGFQEEVCQVGKVVDRGRSYRARPSDVLSRPSSCPVEGDLGARIFSPCSQGKAQMTGRVQSMRPAGDVTRGPKGHESTGPARRRYVRCRAARLRR